MSAGAYSAEAAGGDLADHFRYGFVTRHRPGTLSERQISDFPCGRPHPKRPMRFRKKRDHQVSIPAQVPNIENFATVVDLAQFAAVHQFLRQRHVHASARQQGTHG